MLIKYKFVTGEVTEVEVSEEIGAVILELDRREYNNNHRETRRHYHLEACEYEGDTFAVEDMAFERFVESEAAKAVIVPALEKLTGTQRQLIDALFYRNMSAKEYAAQKGISEAAVSKCKSATLKTLHRLIKADNA